MKFEEIKIGMEESYSKIIRDEDIKNFSVLSGDYNPIHLNEEYAKKSHFKRRIAHGMISSSFFSAIFGTKLPGYGCLYVNQNINFKRPVYLDDKVTAKIIVTALEPSKRRVFFDTFCYVKNKIVIDGTAELYVPKEEKK